MYNSVAADIVTMSCSPHFYLVPKFVITKKGDPHPPPPAPGTH